MSQSQNDARLDELANKVSALRGVTIDIHGQASDQSYIDANRERFAQFGDSIRSTAGKLGRVASTNGFRSQMKMVGVIVGSVIGFYLLWGLFF
ncbi:Putative uncharacterized protein [Taphrina deformans PYCC 5710]|uniref:t-SNARE coiled-coil homology domain-containing protein n=1 Tax=Taphrina deformans (strain PYCC 5710 / ATCC 11124 / CBS 356.35 / IMI 108563 / JCM 9778 / NBRC 8474) TaxID=1097556 RepID=R4X6P0_TAPDE|nr:Putative uncharacterized protein [Taphrina deformans PYCC 5710]|eukprot:CCG80556.1 Putative uncharacterized protein [Taphrina deformans PYCC 5710]